MRRRGRRRSTGRAPRPRPGRAPRRRRSRRPRSRRRAGGAGRPPAGSPSFPPTVRPSAAESGPIDPARTSLRQITSSTSGSTCAGRPASVSAAANDSRAGGTRCAPRGRPNTVLSGRRARTRRCGRGRRRRASAATVVEPGTTRSGAERAARARDRCRGRSGPSPPGLRARSAARRPARRPRSRTPSSPTAPPRQARAPTDRSAASTRAATAVPSGSSATSPPRLIGGDLIGPDVEQRDIVTRAGEEPGERRADRAGADDADPHRLPLPRVAPPRSTVAGPDAGRAQLVLEHLRRSASSAARRHELDVARHGEVRQPLVAPGPDRLGVERGAPARRRGTALISSSPPSSSAGTATTAASATPGAAPSTASTSAEATFSPRRRMRSSRRSTKVQVAVGVEACRRRRCGTRGCGTPRTSRSGIAEVAERRRPRQRGRTMSSPDLARRHAPRRRRRRRARRRDRRRRGPTRRRRRLVDDPPGDHADLGAPVGGDDPLEAEAVAEARARGRAGTAPSRPSAAVCRRRPAGRGCCEDEVEHHAEQRRVRRPARPHPVEPARWPRSAARCGRCAPTSSEL